ncbi:MAG: penicillin-binding protein 1C [Alphaproteobacteria bacterium]|nr:penicillin-binding protein 1C [Alphaproteobacteria bacterium]
MNRPRRWRSALRAGFAGTALLAVLAIVADRLFPPDMGRLDDVSTLVVDSEGRVLRAFTADSGAWRLPVSAEVVDPLFLEMLFAFEDRRYRHHSGVDPLAVVRATAQMLRHRRIVSGASTISMQTARLLEPRPRTIGSKLAETMRAIQLEARYSKGDILNFYLTLTPYGGNLEGIRAASLAWFGKEPRHLAPSEAALLVALPQAPELLRPDRYPGRARQARDKVLDVMLRRGVLDGDSVLEAKREPVPGRRLAMPFHAPHLARSLVVARPDTHVHRTTVDGELQAALEQLLRGEQVRLDRDAGVAVLVVDNDSRTIRAYAGSADFFDEPRYGQIDMAQAIRSPGSTLKPFIYGMAFDDMLVHPETVVTDIPTRFGGYQPENFHNVYRGEVTIREALQQSLNVPAVAVLDAVGARRFDARLRGAGVALRYGGRGEPGLPLALGGVGLSLLDLATLYTGLANNGALTPLSPVVDRPADGPERPEARLFGAAAAWYVTRILEAAPPPVNFVDPGATRDNRRIAYKTGTSYGYRDAWAVGYDRRHTVGVWIGRPDGTPSPDRYGRATAAPVLFKVFGLLPDGSGPANPARPEDAIDVATSELPVRLQRLAGNTAAPASVARALVHPLIVAFPPDGSEVQLDRGGGDPSLPLVAEGGRKPFRWLVNGSPVAAPPHRRRAGWQPDGEGFVQITVIDADGRIARAEVLLR